MKGLLALLNDIRNADDRAAAVARLTDDDLLLLSGMLSLDYEENGDTGEVLGICLVERSTRWGRMMMKGGGK